MLGNMVDGRCWHFQHGGAVSWGVGGTGGAPCPEHFNESRPICQIFENNSFNSFCDKLIKKERKREKKKEKERKREKKREKERKERKRKKKKEKERKREKKREKERKEEREKREIQRGLRRRPGVA